MSLIKTISLLRKCMGEARWCRYNEFRQKVEVFKVLFRLRYQVEIVCNKNGPVTQPIFGFKVMGFNYFELLYLFREIFLDQQYAVELSKKDPFIVDCGANIGMAILFFKMQFPDCHIIAFEPNPNAFNMLKKNITENNLQNVELINAGLSGESKNEAFFIDRMNSLVSSIDKSRAGKEEIKIESVTLSTFVQHQVVDLVKIDIEGAELEVVQEMHKAGALRNVKQYIVEYHLNIGEKRSSLSEFLQVFEHQGFGYNIKSDFQYPGQFQDVALHFVQRDLGS